MKAFAVAACATFAATAAHADLTFCNDGAAERRLAIAYSDGGVWTSEGWWKVPPATCKVVVDGDLTRQHYYVHAPVEGLPPEGAHRFCVLTDAFTLPGADGDCATLGAEERAFDHVDTGKTAKDFTVTLSGDGGGQKEPAEQAPTVAEPLAPEPPAAPEPSAAPGAATAAFAPGTHGEPFTVNALNQGCETRDEGSFCFFYAEGYRWAITQGGPSNPAAMEVLAQSSINTPFVVSGDIISYGDITADAVVSTIAPDSPDAWASLRDAMQGSWVSTDDPNSVIDIYGSERTSVYAGETLDVAVMTWADACPDQEPFGPVVYARMMGSDPMDVQCYAIIDVTEDRMELSYVGRGNTLAYTRLPMGE